MVITKSSLNSTAIKMVFWQICTVCVLAIMLILWNGNAGLSVFLGGVAFCIPNYFFVRRIFTQPTARAAKLFVAKMAIGEVVKLVLSAVLFVLLVKYIAVKVTWALAGFATAIISFWVISFIVMSREGSG